MNIGVGVTVSDTERRQESKIEEMRETGKRRTHLADFLKTRRARLRPEQFDLPEKNAILERKGNQASSLLHSSKNNG